MGCSEYHTHSWGTRKKQSDSDTALLKIHPRQLTFSIQRHKSPASFPETSAFIGTTANVFPETTCHTWGWYEALGCASEKLQVVRPLLDATARKKVLFLLFSTDNWIPLSSLIYFFFPPLDRPPKISKAECPKPILLGTVLSFSHCGFVLHKGAGWDQDLTNSCKKNHKERDRTAQQQGFIIIIQRMTLLRNTWWHVKHIKKVTYDNSSRNKKLLWARAVFLVFVKAS